MFCFVVSSFFYSLSDGEVYIEGYNYSDLFFSKPVKKQRYPAAVDNCEAGYLNFVVLFALIYA